MIPMRVSLSGRLGGPCRWMTIQVQQAEQLSIEQMEEFLRGSRRMEFKLEGQEEVYRLIERVPSHCRYGKLGRRERAIARAYLIKLTNLSRAQRELALVGTRRGGILTGRDSIQVQFTGLTRK